MLRGKVEKARMQRHSDYLSMTVFAFFLSLCSCMTQSLFARLLLLACCSTLWPLSLRHAIVATILAVLCRRCLLTIPGRAGSKRPCKAALPMFNTADGPWQVSAC